MSPERGQVAKRLDQIIVDLLATKVVRLSEVQECAADASRVGTPALVARAHYAVGMCATMQGQDLAAERAYRSAAEHYQRLSDTQASAVSNVGRAQSLLRLGKPKSAMSLAIAARKVLATASPQHAADALMIQATAHHVMGDSSSAVKVLRRVKREKIKLGFSETLLAPLDNLLANALTLVGRAREAKELYDELLRWSSSPDRVLVRCLAQYNLGCLLVMQGRWQGAFECFQELRSQLPATGNPRWVAGADLDEADLHLQLNLLEEARALATRGLGSFRDLQVPAEQARALLVRAGALKNANEPAAALHDYRAARDLYTRVGNHAAAGLCSCHIGAMQLTQRQPGRAARTLDAVQKRFPRAIPPLIRVQYWELRARIALARSDTTAALNASRRAAAALATTSTPWLREQVEHTRGQIHLARGNRGAAARAFNAAIDATEQSRFRVESDALATTFFEGREQPYSDLVHLQLQRRSRRGDRTIFQTIGRLKSRLGIEPGFAKPAPFSSSSSSSSNDKLDDLREQVNMINSRLARMHGQRGDIHVDRTQLHKLQDTRARLEARIARTLRSRRDRTAGTAARARLEPEDVQESLAAGSAFVEYYAVAGRWIAAICTDDTFVVVDDLVAESTLTDWAQKLRFLIRRTAQRDPASVSASALRNVHKLLEKIGDALFTPLLAHLGDDTQRLHVLPHGVLHQLPLAALEVAGVPLIERYELSILPNRRFLTQPARRSRSRSRASRSLASQSRALAVGIDDPALPGVRHELSGVRQALRDTTRLFGKAATRAAFAEAAPHANWLHVATHAQFRADNPMHSTLQLADGWLAAWEIAQLPLQRIRLAVLAACESGRSQHQAGDELLGLARGFFAAGVPTLIANHWPLRDDIAAWTTRSLYRHLAKERSLPCAFQQTLLAARKRHAHPAHWASLTLYGCPGTT
ncbi:MAG: CHAT domain-containing protein [Planctomycetota bacterium]